MPLPRLPSIDEEGCEERAAIVALAEASRAEALELRRLWARLLAALPEGLEAPAKGNDTAEGEAHGGGGQRGRGAAGFGRHALPLGRRPPARTCGAQLGQTRDSRSAGCTGLALAGGTL